MRDRGSPDWWERLGGRNAISIPAWLLTLPGGVLASFSWLPREVHADVAAVVGLSLASHVITGAVLYPAWLTYLSPRPRPPRPWALVATLLVAGGVRGAFLAHASVASGLVTSAPVLARSAGTAVAVLVWFSLATLIVDASRRHRDVMSGLRREVRREQELAERSAQVVRDFRSEQVARAEALVTGHLAHAAAASSDPGRAAAYLRQIAEEVVRPLSHELEQRSLADAEILSDAERLADRPRPPLRDYLVGVVTDRPFAPLVTAVVLVATPLVVTLTVLGPALGGVMLAAAGLSLFAVLTLARRTVAPVLPLLQITVRAIAVIGVWTLATALTGLLVSAIAVLASAAPDSWLTTLGLGTVQSTLVVSVAMASITMLAAAIEGSVEAQRRRAEDSLRSAALATEWAQARLRQRLWSEQRRLGRVLHGDVQARLVAVALQIAGGSRREAAAAVATLARDVRADLAEERAHDWRAAMDDLTAVWELAVDLSVSVDRAAGDALDRDPVACRAVVAVVGEAVTNAVRHGEADNVTVEVRAHGDAVEVSVVDDGRVASDAGSGLGSRMLDAVCLQWSLTHDRVTMLRARVACQRPAGDRLEETA